MTQNPKNRLNELTGLRALGALLVFLQHSGKWIPSATISVPYGGYGVSVFFVLSGYLMTRSYSAPLTEGAMSYWSYAFRRFARLYPTYFFLLMLAYALNPEHQRSALSWLLSLTLINGFFYPAIWEGLSPISWSFTVEVCFYAVAPLIYRLTPYRSSFLERCARLSVILGIWVVLGVGADQLRSGAFLAGYDMVWGYSFFGHFIEFGTGIVLAWWTRLKRFKQVTARLKNSWANGLAVTGFLMLGTCVLYIGPWIEGAVGWSNLLRFALLTAVSLATAMILLAVELRNHLARAVFGNRVVVYLGRISFAAYLLNDEFLYRQVYQGYGGLFPSLKTSVVGFYIFFSAVAALIFECIEKPAQKFLLGFSMQPSSNRK